MNLADQDREAVVALGYRHEAEMFARRQRELTEAGDLDGAKACEMTKFDLICLAAGVERTHRGLCR